MEWVSWQHRKFTFFLPPAHQSYSWHNNVIDDSFIYSADDIWFPRDSVYRAEIISVTFSVTLDCPELGWIMMVYQSVNSRINWLSAIELRQLRQLRVVLIYWRENKDNGLHTKKNETNHYVVCVCSRWFTEHKGVSAYWQGAAVPSMTSVVFY